MTRQRLVLAATLAVLMAAIPFGPGLLGADAAPPANDAFAAAETISGASGSTAGSNAEATKEPGEPDHAGVKGSTSIWFRYVAPAGGLLELSTAGSDFDTALAVYVGTTVDALTAVAGDDDACYPAGTCGAADTTSRVQVPVEVGVTYSIAVDGYGSATGTVALAWTFTDDTTAPGVALGSPGLEMYSTSASIPVVWAGLDASGIAGYDVEVRTYRWNGDDTGWRSWKTGTTATSLTYPGNYGRSYCFRVRATDNVGNVSAFTVPGCTAVPLRSDHLIYGPGWLESTSSDAFGGRFSWTSSQGRLAFRTLIQGEQLAVVVTKCPTCGTLRVYWNGSRMKDLSLLASTTQRSVVVPIATWGWLRSGSITLEVRSASPRLAVLEGLGVYRN